MPKQTTLGITYPDAAIDKWPLTPHLKALAESVDAIIAAVKGKADSASQPGHKHAAADITDLPPSTPGTQNVTGTYSATPTGTAGWDASQLLVERIGATHVLLTGDLYRTGADTPDAVRVATLPAWAKPAGGSFGVAILRPGATTQQTMSMHVSSNTPPGLWLDNPGATIRSGEGVGVSIFYRTT